MNSGVISAGQLKADSIAAMKGIIHNKWILESEDVP
jgi:hypothetical protein